MKEKIINWLKGFFELRTFNENEMLLSDIRKDIDEASSSFYLDPGSSLEEIELLDKNGRYIVYGINRNGQMYRKEEDSNSVIIYGYGSFGNLMFHMENVIFVCKRLRQINPYQKRIL